MVKAVSNATPTVGTTDTIPPIGASLVIIIMEDVAEDGWLTYLADKVNK